MKSAFIPHVFILGLSLIVPTSSYSASEHECRQDNTLEKWETYITGLGKLANSRQEKSPIFRPCIVCKKPASFHCGKCDTAYYCSRTCQTDDWQTHKQQCHKSIVQRAISNVSQKNDNARTLTPEELEKINETAESAKIKNKKKLKLRQLEVLNKILGQLDNLEQRVQKKNDTQ